MSGENRRSKNWNIIVYPDSAPSNWEELMSDYRVEWLCSPLHDKDLDNHGEPKKPHWHITVMYGSLKSYEQVLDLCDLLHSPRPESTRNMRTTVRYMAHLDNPEKAQYDISGIRAFGGADIDSILMPSATEGYVHLSDAIDWIKSNNIVEVRDFVEYSKAHKFDTWFVLFMTKYSNVLTKYINSNRHAGLRLKDWETGEVFDYDDRE